MMIVTHECINNLKAYESGYKSDMQWHAYDNCNKSNDFYCEDESELELVKSKSNFMSNCTFSIYSKEKFWRKILSTFRSCSSYKS